jgi:uncharacterized protein YaaQ
MLATPEGELEETEYLRRSLAEPGLEPREQPPVSDAFLAQLSRGSAQMGTLGGKAPQTTLPTYLKEARAEEQEYDKIRSTEEAARRKQLLQRYQDLQKRGQERQKALLDVEGKDLEHLSTAERDRQRQTFESGQLDKRLGQEKSQFEAKLAFDADMQDRNRTFQAGQQDKRLANALEVAKQRGSTQNKMPPAAIINSEISFNRAHKDAVASIEALKKSVNKSILERAKTTVDVNDATKEVIASNYSTIAQALTKMREPTNQTTVGEVAEVKAALGELKTAQTPERANEILDNIARLVSQTFESQRAATNEVYDRYGINYGSNIATPKETQTPKEPKIEVLPNGNIRVIE